MYENTGATDKNTRACYLLICSFVAPHHQETRLGKVKTEAYDNI